MGVAGYLVVLAASGASPVGYTLMKIAHVRDERGRPSAYLLYLGRLTVVALFPVLVGFAYLYGERHLVPISHASGVVWHTALARLFLPKDKRYGSRTVMGMLVFTAGVSLVIYSVSTLEDNDGDWNRLW